MVCLREKTNIYVVSALSPVPRGELIDLRHYAAMAVPRPSPPGLFEQRWRCVNYLVKSLRLLHTEAMSFSSLRRWANRSTTPSAEIAPNPLPPTGAEAQFLRGLNFASGQGVAQDYTQAAQCYTEAAEQGHSLAQLNLAALYGQGLGVTQDQAKALMWLTKAANLGNAAAQYRLGVQQHLACRTGPAGSAVQGRIEALKWVRLSAAQACPGGESACQFVALSMTRDEVAERARRAASFVPGPSA